MAAVAYSMGCSTTLVLGSDGYFEVQCGKDLSRVYAGPFFDAIVAADMYFGVGEDHYPTPWMLRALAALDMPFSLAADTALLPVSGPLEIRDSLVCGSARRKDEKVIIEKSGEEIEIESEE